MEHINLLISGVFCVVVAIVGGGLKVSGIEIPLLSSIQRQVLLGFFGVGLIISPIAYSKIIVYKETYQCDQYAKTAVEQFDENLKRGCGQMGERWHNVYAGHQGWCLIQSKGSITNETEERKKALLTCNG